MIHQHPDNPYHGVNAHLHSIAQNPHGSPTIWPSLHASHIGHITDALNERLPAGYIARQEQSLQIWLEDTVTGDEMSRIPRPDSAIFRTGQGVPAASVMVAADDPSVRIISIKDWLAEVEITIPSVVVYQPDDHETLGTPVTRIELLSASNKRGGAGYTGYLTNRFVALRSGTSLIELDYLHQSASPLPGVPAYPHEADSHPYTVAVTDPHAGDQMRVYVIDIDQPLPHVNLPLTHGETTAFDFDAVYQHTFRAGRWGIHLDHTTEPRGFASYSAADQARIRAVMARVTAR